MFMLILYFQRFQRQLGYFLWLICIVFLPLFNCFVINSVEYALEKSTEKQLEIFHEKLFEYLVNSLSKDIKLSETINMTKDVVDTVVNTIVTNKDYNNFQKNTENIDISKVDNICNISNAVKDIPIDKKVVIKDKNGDGDNVYKAIYEYSLRLEAFLNR